MYTEERRPVVTVVIPAYNAEKTLHQAVNSVLVQTYGEIELLIVDDCSKDSTAAIAGEYEKKDSRIRLLRNKRNLGVARTRNRGAEAAVGDWIAFLDSDDAWEPDKLEKQLACAAEQRGNFIFTGSSFMDAEGNRKIGVLRVPEKVTYRELLKQNIISCSSVLVKRELVLKYPMEGERLHEDFAVWLQILRDGEIAYGVDEPLLVYRMSASSKSGNKWKAAGMTYRVYRHIGLRALPALYYWCCYVARSLRKYAGIR